jgi:CrcB protein
MIQFTPTTLLAVALGGALGASLRFYVGYFVSKSFPSDFPIATLGVNLIGSFLIGLLVALFIHFTPNEHIKLFLITGFLGALTTYSTFAMETFILLNQSFYMGIINIILNLIGTILLAGLGYKLMLYFLR